MRYNYWTCSKFADWLRGTMKPHAETSEGWYKWNKQAKKSHPFRYWLAEEGLDIIQQTIFYPVEKLYDVKYYINNRWVTRTHSLTAHVRDIRPGTWCDVGNRFLPCLFNELIDFVEVELAWWHIAWDEPARKKFKAPWWSFGWFRWRTWRCPQAGLENLAWQCNLVSTEDCGLTPEDENYGKPTHQAIAAQEILDLYTWWTVQRPKRVDPYDASGWSAHCAERRVKCDEHGDEISFLCSEKTPEEQAHVSKMLDDCRKLEQAYEKEDEDMMIRLIKIRQNLWT